MKFYINLLFDCAIEYGDFSALSDSEIKQLETFLSDFNNASFEYEEIETDYFKKCDISGFYGVDCILTVHESGTE